MTKKKPTAARHNMVTVVTPREAIQKPKMIEIEVVTPREAIQKPKMIEIEVVTPREAIQKPKMIEIEVVTPREAIQKPKMIEIEIASGPPAKISYNGHKADLLEMKAKQFRRELYSQLRSLMGIIGVERTLKTLEAAVADALRKEMEVSERLARKKKRKH